MLNSLAGDVSPPSSLIPFTRQAEPSSKSRFSLRHPIEGTPKPQKGGYMS